ncbi:MAG: XisI protein [Cyanobacteria bacterium P01_G01_bin.54]
MDNLLEHYQKLVHQVVTDYAQYKPSRGEIELQVFSGHDSVLLISFGWQGNRRVHSVILHLRIANEKIWIERDETEEGVTQDLLDLGVPTEDIVLAFYHLEDRKLTDFAVA